MKFDKVDKPEENSSEGGELAPKEKIRKLPLLKICLCKNLWMRAKAICLNKLKFLNFFCA